MLGGAALLADGIITPPISITSAIEGLRELPALQQLGKTDNTIVYIVIGILTAFFFFSNLEPLPSVSCLGQSCSSGSRMLAVLGVYHIFDDLTIFKALSPYYAIDFLANYPQGFWLLGAVFLMYHRGGSIVFSDLGHCGRSNIRVSWIYVKICLLLNYFGQGASLLPITVAQTDHA